LARRPLLIGIKRGSAPWCSQPLCRAVANKIRATAISTNSALRSACGPRPARLYSRRCPQLHHVLLACPIVLRSFCASHAVKCVKGSWLCHTAAMMNYRRIVNARGI
jgi:hypothetical protein